MPASGMSGPILCFQGCAIFEAIRRRWPWARVRVADRGLREGILMTLMREDAVLPASDLSDQASDNGQASKQGQPQSRGQTHPKPQPKGH
jgi:exopolyphosphatase/guanosine-5'-triphosphate,3'-diphosphate pyrophosphatase